MRRWVEQGRISPAWLDWAWAGPMAAGIAVPALALAALDGGIALGAERSGDAYYLAQGGDGLVQHASLAGHLLGILLLAALAVAVATALTVAGDRIMAQVVLAAVAVGPMTVVAAPVTVSLMLAQTVWGQLWWRLLVAAAQFAVLSACLWWTVRCLRAHHDETGTRRPTAATTSEPTLFTAVAALVIAAELLIQPLVVGVSPQPLPLLGWAVLTAAITIVTARTERARTAFVLFAVTALALGAMSVAYLRDAGWPAAAGWDSSTVQTPVVLSVPTALFVLAAPLLGRAARAAMGYVARGPDARPAGKSAY